MSGLGEVEWKRIQHVDMKSAVGQGGWSSTTEVPSGIVELVEKTQRRQEKNRKKKEKKKEKEEKKKESENEKGRLSDLADSTVGDLLATPPSHALESKPIYFQYAEGSMNLTMMVRQDFDANPNSSVMKQLCFQVSDIYSNRLDITSSVSNIKFNFTILAPDSVLVTLKDDEMGLGFEDQVQTCWTSLSDALIKNEELEQSLLNFQAQPEVKGVDFEKLQAKVADMEKKLQAKVADMEKKLQAFVADMEKKLQAFVADMEKIQ